MSPKVDIASLTVSKLKSGMSFEKYNIDVSIDEVENNETGIRLKYKFILLSTPTNSKISVESLDTNGSSSQPSGFDSTLVVLSRSRTAVNCCHWCPFATPMFHINALHLIEREHEVLP